MEETESIEVSNVVELLAEYRLYAAEKSSSNQDFMDFSDWADGKRTVVTTEVQ